MHILKKLLIILIFLTASLPLYAEPIDDTVRLLREQRAIAEDLALSIKMKYRSNTPEYKEAKRLYDNTSREYKFFIEDFTFSIAHSELKDLNPSVLRADTAAKEFQNYVKIKTKTLGGSLPGYLELGEGLAKAVEIISKEIRDWIKFNKDERKELSEDLARLLGWKEWDKIN